MLRFIALVAGLFGKQIIVLLIQADELLDSSDKITIKKYTHLVGLVSRELANERGMPDFFFGIVPVCRYAEYVP